MSNSTRCMIAFGPDAKFSSGSRFDDVVARKAGMRPPSAPTAGSARPLPGVEQLADLLGRADRHDLEFGQVTPLEDPPHEQAHVIALHELEAAVEVHLDPAIDVLQAVGQRPPRLADPPADGH